MPIAVAKGSELKALTDISTKLGGVCRRAESSKRAPRAGASEPPLGAASFSAARLCGWLQGGRACAGTMSQAEQVAAEVPHRESKRHFGEPRSPNAIKAPSIIKHHQGGYIMRSKFSRLSAHAAHPKILSWKFIGSVRFRGYRVEALSYRL